MGVGKFYIARMVGCSWIVGPYIARMVADSLSYIVRMVGFCWLVVPTLLG